MVEGKSQAVHVRVRAVEEVVHGEPVRLVYRAGIGNGVQHGADDDVGIDDGQIKHGVVFLHELPCRPLGECLRCIVAQYGVLGLDRLRGRYLPRNSVRAFLRKREAKKLSR
jgi:hypothetical protein